MCTSPVQKSRTGMAYRCYSPSAVTNAYFAVTESCESIKGTARKFGIPEATLRDRVRGRISVDVTKSGKDPLFTLEEERALVEHLKVMSSYGYGYSRSEVVDIGSTYAVSLGKRDEDHPLSLMWFHNFMKRWPELKVKKPRGLELQRAKATTEGAVTSYFDELSKILTKYDLKNSPERIYNIDEKGLKQNHSPPYVVAADGNAPPAITSGKGSTVTVIGCGNALGQQIPPYFVFPGKRMRPELLKGGTPGSDGTVSDSGWSNSTIFMEYLSGHFLKFAQGRDGEKPLLVLYDGHKSHISLPLIDWAKQHNIQLFILPAHTSHVLQPLDIGCFGPFERIYNAECHKYMRANSCTGIDRYSICELACRTYSKALSPENLQSSFRKSGIYPLDPTVVDKSIFIPAEVLKEKDVTGDKKDSQPVNSDRKEVFDMVKAPEERANKTSSQDKSQDVQITSVEFFKTREDKIGKREKPAEKRRCLSKVVSGKAITENDTVQKIQEHQQTVGSAKKKSSVEKKSAQNESVNKTDKKSGKKSGQPTVPQFPLPSTSGISSKKDQGKRSLSPSDYSDESDIEEEEKCCKCNRFQPVELAKSTTVYFTKWGQCMFQGCNHWTHLKFCCEVGRLSSKDTFYCPCHGVPCLPMEE